MTKIGKILSTSLAFIFASGAFAFAQGGYTVSGVVQDKYGPVIGATIVEQGTSNGTSTGMDGEYELTVSGPSAPVEISCIGYASQQYEAAKVPGTIS